MAKIDSSLWTEKYRPNSVSDMVMPKEFKKFFSKIVKDGEIPNLLLSSPTPGTGKCLDFSEKINIQISEEFYEKYKDLFED